MKGHRALLIPMVCFVASLLGVFLAGATLVHAVRLNAGWVLLATASVVAILALQLQRAEQDRLDAIAERQKAGELFHARQLEQSQLVDALADGLEVAVFICDSRATIEYANRRACELFRFENPMGRAVLAVTLSYDLEQLVLRATRSGSDQSAEISFPYPDERVGLAKAWPSSGARVFLSVYEITALRRLERIRQDFVANVSHELRTPMTVIRAYAETLLDEAAETDELAQRYLPRIVSEVDRLSSMTGDLLILSAAESNPVRKQSCDVAEVVRNVVNQLQIKANDKALILSYAGPDHLTIAANPAQLTQVVLNLVDNAINYTPEGSVSAELSADGSNALLKVRDTGIGIPSDQLGRIFERFYRVDKGRSRSTGGTGLGLSIVKHIVEAHGGTVSVESVLNRGTQFEVSLPVDAP